MRRKMRNDVVAGLMVLVIGSGALVGCGASKDSMATADMSVAYENGAGYYEVAEAEMAGGTALDTTAMVKEEGMVEFNTEEYSAEKETGFAQTSVSPLSTFSADVDTASYSNLRRMIEAGYGLEDIPEGAVRIEELLNYFDYDYNLPQGDDRVLLEGVSGDETEKICDALDALEAGGSTNGSKGIETAYELAEEFFIEDGNNRVILATDGDLNVGTTSESELVELIEEKRESGIYLTVLGCGTGNIKDNKMEALADNGNGNYAYIDSFGEAKKVLVEEMGSTLVTVAKDVKLQVEFNLEKVAEYRLLGYENRRLDTQDFEDDTKDAGEIGAGHTVTALYEIVPVEDGKKAESDLKYSETVTNGSDEWLTISVRYKEPDEEESILLEYPVDESAYTENPSDDWKFAAAAAEFGLVVTDSSYKGEASLEHVKFVLKELDIEKDEYKEEFYGLVKKLIKNS